MSTPRLAAKVATTPTVQETCRARPCLHSSGEFCAKLNVPLIRYIIEPTLFPKNLCSALRRRTLLLSVLISIDDDLKFGLFEYWCSIYSSREVQSKTPFKTQLVSVHRSTPYLTVGIIWDWDTSLALFHDRILDILDRSNSLKNGLPKETRPEETATWF